MHSQMVQRNKSEFQVHECTLAAPHGRSNQPRQGAAQVVRVPRQQWLVWA